MEAPTLEARLPLLLPQPLVLTQQQHKVEMTPQQLLATVTVLVGIWIPAFLFVLLSHQTFSKTVFNNACKTVPSPLGGSKYIKRFNNFLFSKHFSRSFEIQRIHLLK